MGGYVWNKLFRSNVIKTSPTIQFDETMDCYEDLKFVLEYIKRTKEVVKLNEAVYVYNRDNVQSISHMQVNLESICKLEGLESVCTILESFPNGTVAVASRKNQLMKMCASFYGRLLVAKNTERKECIALIKKLVRSNADGFKADSSWNIKHKIMFAILRLCC